MRRAIGMLLAVGAILCVTEAATAQEAQASGAKQAGGVPVMNILNGPFNWGTVTQGDEVRHEFKIKNDGTAPIVISSVKGTCGCTSTEWDDRIEPGETGTVTLVIDTETLPGAAGLKKHGNIVWNNPDPKSQITQLEMTGNITALFQGRTKNVNAKGVIGSHLVESVSLEASPAVGFQATRVEAEKGNVEIENFSADESGNVTFDVKTVAAPTRPTTGQDFLWIYGRNPGDTEDRRTRLAMRYNFVERVHANRPRIQFSPGWLDRVNTTGEPVERDVRILSATDDIEFDIVSVELVDLDPEVFEITRQTFQDKHHYKVGVKVNKHPGYDYGRKRGEVLVKTNDPAVPELRIPVIAYFEEPQQRRAPTPRPVPANAKTGDAPVIQAGNGQLKRLDGPPEAFREKQRKAEAAAAQREKGEVTAESLAERMERLKRDQERLDREFEKVQRELEKLKEKEAAGGR